MATIKGLNAHDRPPEKVREVYKKYLRIKMPEIDQDPEIIDLEKLDVDNLPSPYAISGSLDSADLRLSFDEFVGVHKNSSGGKDHHGGGLIEDIPILTHSKVTGLHMIPALYPPTVQSKLLDLMLHRDLSNPEHQTNLHLHYDIEYPHATGQSADKQNESPISFFGADPTTTFAPKDPHVHKPMTIQNMLDKKLRWITFGGQYNWTTKVYPEGQPPPFPEDIAHLLRASFPETEAQAAIVNFYSANDTFIGCDALFMISHDDGEGCEVIRLRSGDAVYMSGQSRFAWHGVPKIIPDTCPKWLCDWPGPGYPYWQGWMGRKRVNLNVRQMMESN
ncbi:oxidoreductase, 2OG-Fe(II) oxygenase family, putative [Talaromyces stipitatus ATCC 10500]|uniref:Oxidoreductase, 2OG-Fe(II) oxygenase family, putative n=1 Tax=Talaromyces stipitatus (strain ATCC 10500 / CBS 375.48 / QM 6759 / NRRL 1006) TaxID=441959 RepID=B8M368_TALSN|nr:oxidoreductase, 2OG-Fe(II) oxygenase family, putative [Talaromyces stipitatus ATCC 10500]EED22044.1 oxidoreductase, 2OG-Fe(II) oxygenase family, putative [Talaromyces stipitatus ATCC 10500]